MYFLVQGSSNYFSKKKAANFLKKNSIYAFVARTIPLSFFKTSKSYLRHYLTRDFHHWRILCCFDEKSRHHTQGP